MTAVAEPRARAHERTTTERIVRFLNKTPIHIGLGIIALIWLRVRERATPFLVTAGFIAVEMIAMGVASAIPALKQLDVFIGQVPHAMIVLTGFTIGGATSWLGWQAGKRPAVPVGAVPQPA